MAIDFNPKENNSSNSNKFIIIMVVLIILIVCFFFFKNKNLNSKEVVLPGQMYQPINIDFNFISSEEFLQLENFRGIPVLPGFFDASDTQIKEEKIAVGRDNPFKEVSFKEIELAIIKVIQQLMTLEEIGEMRSAIESSSLYTEQEKNSLYTKLNEQEEIVKLMLNSEEKTEEKNEDKIISNEEEVELAIVKVIQRLMTLEEIKEIRNTVKNSSLYTEQEKDSLNSKIDEQEEMIKKMLALEEGESVIEEVISNEETEPIFNEEGDEFLESQDKDYYKEW